MNQSRHFPERFWRGSQWGIVNTGQSRPWALPLVLLGIVTISAWGAVVFGSFQYDDYGNVVMDPATSELGAWWSRIWGGIRPLTRTTFFLDHSLWGMKPGGFLLTNLLVHLTTVVGVFWLARRRLGQEATAVGAAFVAALVFALQPAHAETIAYVSGRSTGLMACLLVWALAAHEQSRRSVSWVALVLFVAACLAKEVALVFPVLVWLWETTRPADEAEPNKAHPGMRELPYALTAALCAATIFASPRFRELMDYSLTLRSPSENLLLQLRAVPEMLSLWFRPGALSIDHAFLAEASVWTMRAGAAVLCGLLGLALVSRRRAPILYLAIAWALVALLPTNSVIAKLDVVTEKPLYLAWMGPSLLAGWLWSRAITAAGGSSWAWRRRALAWTLATALCLAAVTCAWRVRVWSDDRLLWTDALTKNPTSSRTWNNAGLAFAATDPTLAAAAFRRAVELNPDNNKALDNLLLYAILENR